MRRFILAALLVLLIPLVASAANTNKYPDTLVDQTCADDNDVPAAVTPELTVIGGSPTIHAPGALVQLSGSADGFCDNDSRIIATIASGISADTRFGPFSMPLNYPILFGMFEGSAVTGGDTKWRVRFEILKPHEAEFLAAGFDTTLVTGNVDLYFAAGLNTTIAFAGEDLDAAMPRVFYMLLDLNTATSWTGDASLMVLR